MRYILILTLLLSAPAARAAPPTVIRETAAQIARGAEESNIIPFRSGVVSFLDGSPGTP